VLFRHAEGSVLTPRTQTNVTARIYGYAVARLHRATNGFASESAPALDRSNLIDRPLGSIERRLQNRPSDARFIRSIADAAVARIQTDLADLPIGICHGDLNGGNAALEGDGTVRFYDFERCGVCWRAYDVAVFRWGAAMGTVRLGWSDVTVERLWASYVDGYTRAEPISDAELRATEVLVPLRHFWYLGLECENDWRWPERILDGPFWDRELHFLRAWVDRHW
jgi:Ser/Thr protein kinase RdoA (MazF antagonist)